MKSPPKTNIRRITSSLASFRFGAGGKSSDVFAINLIRSRSFFHLNRRVLSFLTLGYFIAQGLLFLGLVFWGLGLGVKTFQLDQSFRRAFPLSVSGTEFQTQLNQLSQRARASLAELKTAVAIEKDKFRIAGKLAGIARTIPVRTWVSSIRLDASERSMNIEAGFLVDPADPDRLPVKGWIDALAKDPGFGPWLKKIEQIHSSENQKGQAEICLFEIQAGW